jgi:tetratricopeptide (TPR) repeat protein
MVSVTLPVGEGNSVEREMPMAWSTRIRGGVLSHPAREKMPRLTYASLLVAIFFLGLALRLHALGADSLWIDEIYTVSASQMDLGSIPSFVVTDDSHPPLLYVMTKLFVGLVGGSEFALRLPAALLGSLSILLTGKVGEFLWGRREGLVGAFLLSVSAYHVQYSQEARHYVLLTFFALFSLASLLAALRTNRKTLWLAFALSTTMNLYLHYFAFFVLPAELLLAGWVILESWLATRRGRSRLLGDQAPPPEGAAPPAAGSLSATAPHGPPPDPMRMLYSLLASMALVGALYLPWLPSMRQQLLGPIIEVEGLAVGAVPQATLSGEFVYQLLSTYTGVEGFPLLLFVALLALGLANSGRRQLFFVGAWICTPFLVTLLVQAGHYFNPKYALYVVPIYLLTVARGTTCLAGWLQRASAQAGQRRFTLSWATVLLVVLLGGLGAPALVEYYRFSRADWRSVTAYLNENMSADDIIIADGKAYGDGGDSNRAARALTYYFSLSDREPTVLRAQRGLAPSLEQFSDGGARVWGVLWHSEELPSLNLPVPGVELVEFPGVVVLRPDPDQRDLLEGTASVLEALLLVQPMTVGRFDLHLALAELRHEMGEPEEAATQVSLAQNVAGEYLAEVALDPTLESRSWGWEPYWDLGKTYQQLGMYDLAAAAFEQVVSLNPDYAQAYLDLGIAYRQLGLPTQALAAYQRALDMEPEDAQVHYLVGEGYRRLGRIEEAKRAYQEALRLDPTQEASRRTLQLFSHPLDEDVAHRLLHSLGQQLALLGYDVSTTAPEAAGTLDLSLWWQAVANVERDYTVFVHLADGDGHLWAQADALLQHDGRPSSTWRPGLVVKEECTLELPAEIPPGEYEVSIGVYYWETRERLPVWDEDGQRVEDDTIPLLTVDVGEQSVP